MIPCHHLFFIILALQLAFNIYTIIGSLYFGAKKIPNWPFKKKKTTTKQTHENQESKSI